MPICYNNGMNEAAALPPKQPLPSLKWVANEYHYVEKSADWYWTLGIIAVAIAIASIVFGNVLFALLVLIGTFVLGLYAARKPDQVEIEISGRGIRAGGTLFPFRSLQAFWLEDEDPKDDIPPRLLIKSSKLIMPLLIFHLTKDVDPEDVRYLLGLNLREEHLEEPFGHQMMDALGF